jgi:hypothetical protein
MSNAIPHIDPWQFYKHGARPVSARTRISFDDWESMGLHRDRHFAHALYKIPSWALDDTALREVIVSFLEVRARIGRGIGTLAERLARAEKALCQQLPMLNSVLDQMCREYMAAEDPARKKELQVAIEGYDTTIRIATKGAATLAAVVYLYHRLRWDSARVAAELQLKPPHIRQILYRMNQVAEKLKNGTLHVSKPRGPKPKTQKTIRLDTIVAVYLRAHDWKWRDISDFLGIPEACLFKRVRKAGLLVKRGRRGKPRAYKRRRLGVNGVLCSYLHKHGHEWSFIGRLFGLSAAKAQLRARHAEETLLRLNVA